METFPVGVRFKPSEQEVLQYLSGCPPGSLWWKMQVEDYLYQKDLYLPLVGEKPEAMNVNEWAILDKKTLATVRLSLTPQVAFNISHEKTIAAMMKALEKFSVMNGEMQRKTIDDGISSSTVLSVKFRELQKNLISVSGLDREGYFTAFGEKQWKVIKGSMVEGREWYGNSTLKECIARDEEHSVGFLRGLCLWKARVSFWRDGKEKNTERLELVYTDVCQRTASWHHRLGHLSESGIRILHSKNALPGMKNIQLDFYEGCVYGKQKRVSFQRDGKEKKTERLELVHTDVCGPTTISLLEWKALVENETWNKVKCLTSDNGGEYRDGGFQEYYSNNGIRLMMTVKRTPQENGLAEKMNRTIMERTRCTRIHADLPLQFWVATVDTAIYLINRSPASALNGGS
ncbi:hypothetical protein RJ640_003832 [Escallonia rubra]|uniref:Integrase catalytic domain-containing protein n=1 Tax=Escallonia rubra TaxID=112253 RepID=A0AA88R826_9ASTE|nr:hypothetical protein RJ640_003832 [Escallonia rubra]